MISNARIKDIQNLFDYPLVGGDMEGKSSMKLVLNRQELEQGSVIF